MKVREYVYIYCKFQYIFRCCFFIEDQDYLFYVIHEKVPTAPGDIVPHLWTYRSRITLEHLLQILQTKKSTCPILHEFLQMVYTQYHTLSSMMFTGTSVKSHSISTWDCKTATTVV